MALAVCNAQESNPFYIGHSLVNHNMPLMVQALADDAGQTTNHGKQIINGSPLQYNYNNPDNAEGTPYTSAFPDGNYNTLVLTEAIPLQNHLTWSGTFEYANSFYNYAKDNNNGAPVSLYIYETWHCVNSGIPQLDWPTGCAYDDSANSSTLWQPRLQADFPLWSSIVTDVRNQNPTESEIWMVPAGQAFYDLTTEINAGNLPGISNFTDLFVDDIHLTNAGNYFVACVMYATIYKQSPVGLTTDINTQWGTIFEDMPTPDQAMVMQQVAWAVVTRLKEWTGVTSNSVSTENLSADEQTFSIYPNPATEFITIESNGSAGIEEVRIYDSMGSLVKEVFLVNQRVDISDLPSGLYLIAANASPTTMVSFIK